MTFQNWIEMSEETECLHCDMFQKAGLVWSGLEEGAGGGEEEPPAGPSTHGGPGPVGGLGQWMAAVAEHVNMVQLQDTVNTAARLPLLWPKLIPGIIFGFNVTRISHAHAEIIY